MVYHLPAQRASSRTLYALMEKAVPPSTFEQQLGISLTHCALQASANAADGLVQRATLPPATWSVYKFGGQRSCASTAHTAACTVSRACRCARVEQCTRKLRARTPSATASNQLQPLQTPIPLHVLDSFRDLPIVLQGAPLLHTNRVLFGAASAKFAKHLNVRMGLKKQFLRISHTVPAAITWCLCCACRH